MNRNPYEMDVKWLDLCIAETQQQIQHEKNQLEKSERTGLDIGTSCRNLAVKAKYLEVLKVRKLIALNVFNFEINARA